MTLELAAGRPRTPLSPGFLRGSIERPADVEARPEVRPGGAPLTDWTGRTPGRSLQGLSGSKVPSRPGPFLKPPTPQPRAHLPEISPRGALQVVVMAITHGDTASYQATCTAEHRISTRQDGGWPLLIRTIRTALRARARGAVPLRGLRISRRHPQGEDPQNVWQGGPPGRTFSVCTGLGDPRNAPGTNAPATNSRSLLGPVGNNSLPSSVGQNTAERLRRTTFGWPRSAGPHTGRRPPARTNSREERLRRTPSSAAAARPTAAPSPDGGGWVASVAATHPPAEDGDGEDCWPGAGTHCVPLRTPLAYPLDYLSDLGI